VVLVRSSKSIKAADLLPSNIGRASRVHALINAFGLQQKLTVIAPVPLTNRELEDFHSEDYINCLLSTGDGDGESQLAEYGLLDDCYMFDGVEQHVRYAAGGTVSAARCLANGDAGVAVHWEGGRHHCKREQASGFCYVNDIVLGILELNKTFSRVLYVDMDLHHGDGVQDAFLYSSRVMTLSLHHYDRGFYPNTGANDESFLQAFEEATGLARSAEATGLAGDPYKIFNLTTDAPVLGWGIPTLLLGGGGYSSVNCARCWTRLTAIACGQDIDVSADIPDHEFYEEYVPVFTMAIDRRLVPDENTPESISSTIDQIRSSHH
ncbi:histone deacetylase 8, partial [Linderina pennispora]